jgi:polysaccharide export outer membrane protein
MNNHKKYFQWVKMVWLVWLMTACAPTPISNNLVLPSPRPEVPKNPPKFLENFQELAANTEDENNYRLGSGDELSIDVWGHPELSGKHVVGPDGKITLPLVGPFRVTGLSREQAARAITTTLTPYYVVLTVTVRVDRYASNRVLVLGRVGRPGEVHFGMTSPTLLEAISLAGGFAEARGLEGMETLPFTHCAVFRGRDQIVWIELEPLLTGKDLSLNLKLQRHDIVYIPELEEKLVYVLGEVTRPGAYRLTPNMSFLTALAKAGGPSVDAAPNRINLIRPTKGVNQSLSLSELITPNNNLNVAVQEGDIIYVPTNAIAKIDYAVKILSPFSTMLRMYADITSVRANQRIKSLNKQEETLNAREAAVNAERAANAAEKTAIDAQKAAKPLE